MATGRAPPAARPTGEAPVGFVGERGRSVPLRTVIKTHTQIILNIPSRFMSDEEDEVMVWLLLLSWLAIALIVGPVCGRLLASCGGPAATMRTDHASDRVKQYR